MTVPQYTQARITSAVGTHYGVSSVLRSSNGIVYSSVAAPVPSTYAITTQPGSIFSTSYNSLSGMHTSDTMPSLSTLQNQPLTRSHSFLSTIAVTTAEEQSDLPLNLETVVSMAGLSTTLSDVVSTVTTVATLDTYTNASLEAIAASLEALSSPLVPGDGQYQMEREFLELEKMKQQRLAEELEWERQEIQRFHEQEQLLAEGAGRTPDHETANTMSAGRGETGPPFDAKGNLCSATGAVRADPETPRTAQTAVGRTEVQADVSR